MTTGKGEIMKDIKVLGSGCATCQRTAELLQTEADKLGVPITIEKITDYAAIASYGIAATPGVVVNGKVVHAGGLPRVADVDTWLQA
jgi:small redox-active disulfide protein 2